MALHFSGLVMLAFPWLVWRSHGGFIYRHLSSETIEIIAQSGEKRFFVHRDILAAQSEPLRHIVRDGPAEHKVDLQEWDGDTVGRFVEFLYIGHYQAPSPTQRPESSAVSEVGTGADTPATSRPGTARSDSTETGRSECTTTTSPVGPRPLTPLWQFGLELQDRAGPYIDREAPEVFRLGLFDPAVCDYGEVLLAHAKVYSLAQNQEVEALRNLSRKYLLSTLLRIGSVEPGWQVTVDFIALLRYVYSHTVLSPGDSEEPLQKIVSQFAALNFPALQGRDEMTELIREGGKLASDLMNKVYKRLAHSESLLQEVPTLRAKVQRLEEVERLEEVQRLEEAQRLEEIKRLGEAQRLEKVRRLENFQRPKKVQQKPDDQPSVVDVVVVITFIILIALFISFLVNLSPNSTAKG